MNRTFIMLLLIEASMIVFNLLSTWLDMNYRLFPVRLVEFVNSLFFALFYLRGYVYFFYFTTVIKDEAYFTKTFSILKRIPLQLCILMAATSPWTRMIFYVDAEGYHSGPYYKILYVEFWFYIALSYLITFACKVSTIQKREKISIFWANTLLLIGTFFRLFLPQVLIMDTFCVLAVTVLYLSFENPDFYLERRSRMFNNKAFSEYLEEINGKKPYSILAFIIHNYRDLREMYGVRQMDVGVELIGSFLLNEFPDMEIFYCRSGRFAILGDETLELEADNIRKKIEERFESSWNSDDTDIYFDVSFVYIKPGKKGLSTHTIISVLIQSLGKVANAGSEDYVLIDEKMVHSTEQDAEIKRILENAIDLNQVEVFLQPIVDAATQKMVGAEALARIRDDDGKLISPGLFIPIAEQNGRINQLGEQVLDKVCKFVAASDMEKMGLNWINVNLSPIQFIRHDLKERLERIIGENRVAPSYIHFEVTEQSFIDEGLLFNQIHSIQKSGFYFVLDDYGSGYSNPARLKKCPFIGVKMDMSLVWEYAKKPDELLPNMVSTYSKLGFLITAEGVEDENMAKMMTDIGCDYLQGYYFDKPLTMDEFIAKYS
ncbi:EAL domain-containing protein [Butyrivibrio sp. AE2015]|uniref:EAL domain-containing protein n=1 Tax=Butyrivibrio sp. AE2015 TaxID=1280663 RepID=UPI0018CB200B|nr:EAL domain-containing protein [Butyrivibrio sp. AE2015]